MGFEGRGTVYVPVWCIQLSLSLCLSLCLSVCLSLSLSLSELGLREPDGPLELLRQVGEARQALGIVLR